MKLLFFILFFSINASAQTYYVSNSGSNAATGLTTGTAFQTIAYALTVAGVNDTVLLNKGDSFNERINVPASNMFFSAYGTGEKPIVTGFQNITLSNEGGNIWSATATNSVKQLNTVLVAGTLRAKARIPNTGYYTFLSNSGKTQLTTSLTGTPNYTGAECVIRNAHWIIDVCKISSQSGGVLNFSNEMTYATPMAFGSNGFFIQNVESALDIDGEWCYDSTSKVLKVYYAGTPSVQVSTIDTLVHIGGESYITFDGISFTGANKAAFQLDTANHITIKNCVINNSGTIGISALKSNRLTIQNNSILNSLSGGIYARQVDPYVPTVNACDSALIDNNYIKNVGHIAGMGMSNNCRYIGIMIAGAAPVITNNTVDSVGYVSVFFNGPNALVQKNFITNYCFIKDDGGGIYTVIGGYVPLNYNDGSIIRSNIVINGITAPEGTSSSAVAGAPGIFLDNTVKLVTVDSNTVISGKKFGILLNETNTVTLRENTVVADTGTALSIYGVNGLVFSLNIKKNVFYSSNASWKVIERFAGTTVATIDSNYYLRPSSETDMLRAGGINYSLAGWKTFTGQDANTVGMPAGVTSAAPLVYYNPTYSDSTITLSGRWISAKGTVYEDSVTLAPFQSQVLFYTNAQPVPSQRLNRIKIRGIN